MKILVFIMVSIFLSCCSDSGDKPDPVANDRVSERETPAFFLNVDVEQLDELGITYLVSDEEAQSTIMWVARCRPSLATELAQNDYAVQDLEGGDQAFYRLFPILAKIEYGATPDDSVVSNPRDYDIDLDRITQNHQTAPCDLPDDYTIVGYVTALDPSYEN
jgi:hypothetical protein